MILKQDIKNWGQLLFRSYEFPWGWVAFTAVALLDGLWESHSWLVLPYSWLFFLALLFPLNIKLLLRGLIAADIKIMLKCVPALKRILIFFEYAVLCSGTSLMLVFLSYLVCSWSYPLIDPYLNQTDLMLGFNWLNWFQWVQVHLHDNPSGHFAFNALGNAYSSMAYQYILFAVWFSVSLRKDRLYEIFWILFVALVSTVIIAGFLPAIGPASIYGVEEAVKLVQPDFSKFLSDTLSIRAGQNLALTTHTLVGMVTFPSFHTACAIIYAYAFRGTGSVGYAILVINIAMLVSIPVFGDHYLTDMIGGVIIACASIALVRTLSKKIKPSLAPSLQAS